MGEREKWKIQIVLKSSSYMIAKIEKHFMEVVVVNTIKIKDFL